jgi:hypothetical protein
MDYLQGTEDEIVDYSHGKRLWELYPRKNIILCGLKVEVIATLHICLTHKNLMKRKCLKLKELILHSDS